MKNDPGFLLSLAIFAILYVPTVRLATEYIAGSEAWQLHTSVFRLIDLALACMVVVFAALAYKEYKKERDLQHKIWVVAFGLAYPWFYIFFEILLGGAN